MYKCNSTETERLTGRMVCMWWSTLTGPSWLSFWRKCGSPASSSMAYFRVNKVRNRSVNWNARLIMRDDVPAVLVSLASGGRAIEPGIRGSGFCPKPGVRAPAHDGGGFVTAFGS